MKTVLRGSPRITIVVTICALCVPPQTALMAVEVTAHANIPGQPVDVELADHGVLHAWILDTGGRASPPVKAEIYRDGKLETTVTSGVGGKISVPSLRGGTYVVAIGGELFPLRLWAPHSAPPGTRRHTILVTGDVMRAQFNPMACLLGNPWIVSGVVVAAIVIPVAIHNNRADRPPSS